MRRINDAAASIFNVMNDYLAERAYSRKLEEEADSLGLKVCHSTLDFYHYLIF